MSSEPIIRTFTDAMASMEDGQLIQDLADMQRDILAALHNASLDQGGKPKASLSIKLDYKMDSGVIEIVADVKSSLPKTKRARTVMWATPENNLCRNNPRQRNLFEDVNRNDDGGFRPVRTA